jgi:hypothetical protein
LTQKGFRICIFHQLGFHTSNLKVVLANIRLQSSLPLPAASSQPSKRPMEMNNNSTNTTTTTAESVAAAASSASAAHHRPSSIFFFYPKSRYILETESTEAQLAAEAEWYERDRGYRNASFILLSSPYYPIFPTRQIMLT